MHIRQLGPPLLFATETFESFNAVIRGFSIHSNRQAPSRDIAHAFANANRIRHLLSGAKFFQYDCEPKSKLRVTTESEPAWELSGKNPPPPLSRFDMIGKDVLELIDQNKFIQKTFGGPEGKILKGRTYRHMLCDLLMPYKATQIRRDGLKLRSWKKTLTSKMVLEQAAVDAGLTSLSFAVCKLFTLKNGDDCGVNEWVLLEVDSRRNKGLLVGKVLEVLQIAGFNGELVRQPDIVLVEIYRTSKTRTRYYMPRLERTDFHVMALYSVRVTVTSVRL